MKSLKNLLLTKSIIAAAIAGGGIATPAVSHAIAASGPSAGVFCRAGYTGAFDGTRLKCSKVRVVNVPLRCLDTRYPTYLVRAVVGPTGVGRDFCLKNGVQLGTTDPLGNLVLGSPGVVGDYVHATFDPAEVASKVTAEDVAEATAQGLSASAVDTVSATPVIDLGGGGGNKDRANVTLTHFTYAIEGGIVLGGTTGTVTSTTPFVPRPLP